MICKIEPIKSSVKVDSLKIGTVFHTAASSTDWYIRCNKGFKDGDIHAFCLNDSYHVTFKPDVLVFPLGTFSFTL